MNAHHFLLSLRQAPAGVDARFYQSTQFGYSLGLGVHVGSVLLFALLGVPVMAWYNLFSVLVWVMAIVLLRRGRVMASWLTMVTEIIVHAMLAVYMLGSETGFQYFVLVLAVISYIIPGDRRKMIPITVVNLVVFTGLTFYARGRTPLHILDPDIADLLFIGNLAITIMAISVPMAYYMRILEDTEAALEREHARSESLLFNILPAPIAARLKSGKTSLADNIDAATVLFADIVGFTEMTRHAPAQDVVNLLDDLFSRLDELVARHGLEKIKTIGDAYMVAAGVPEPRPDHATAIARFALDTRKAVHDFNTARGTNLQVRIGFHSGPLTAGVIGKLRFLYDLWGDTVNTASRMESHGRSGDIQVSDTTHDLIRDQFSFEDRGIIDVKGKGPMHTWLLTGERTAVV